MKAAVYHDIGQIALCEVPDPALEDGGLVIKVDTCAICGADNRTYRHGHRHVNPPQVLGHEVTGVVIETASDRFREGDRVQVAPAISCGACKYCRVGLLNMCDDRYTVGYHIPGGFAEKMGIPAQAVRMGNVSTVPESLSLEEASLAEPLACCVNGQELARVDVGDSVLVIGAGPVGCMHASLARALGATCVIMTDSDLQRLALASRIVGPDLAVNPLDLDAAVMEVTEGTGVKVVMVAAGAPEAQAMAVRLAAKMGRVCFFAGLPAGSDSPQIDANLVHYRQLSLFGAFSSTPRHNRRALGLLSQGKVSGKNVITARLPLDDIAAAFELARQPEHLRVVLKP